MGQNRDISDLSPYFLDQFSDNRLFRDLLRGLSGVRGTKATQLLNGSGATKSPYLPQFDAEPDPVYNQRVNRSYLTNWYLRTIQSDSGKILASPVLAQRSNQQPLPDSYDQWLDDMDLEGMPLDVFARNQLQMGQAKGISLAYVDYITEEQRPFVHEIDIDNVLSFRTNARTGRLNFLRWKGSIIGDSEDEHLLVDNTNVIFEITPTAWQIFDEDDLSQPKEEGEIVRYIDGSTRITNEIPVSVFYTDKQGVLLADSPYRSLAELTIEHFQVRSDLKNMMFYALQPILFANNVPEDFKITALASYMMVSVPDNGENTADMKWVQVDSDAIEQAREDIADLESRISAFGIDANGIRPSGNQTATQSAIDSAGSNAALKMFASGLQEHLERIISLMASYQLEAIEPEVTITPDFNVADNSEKSGVAVEAFKSNLISGKAATDVLVQNNILPKSFNYEEDQEFMMNSQAVDGMT